MYWASALLRVLDDSVEPPFPKKGIYALVKSIVNTQMVLNTSGKVSAIAEIDEQGRVVKIKVLESPHKILTDRVTSFITKTPFDPGLCDGAPCASEFLLEFRIKKQSATAATLTQPSRTGQDRRVQPKFPKVKVLFYQGWKPEPPAPESVTE